MELNGGAGVGKPIARDSIMRSRKEVTVRCPRRLRARPKAESLEKRCGNESYLAGLAAQPEDPAALGAFATVVRYLYAHSSLKSYTTTTAFRLIIATRIQGAAIKPKGKGASPMKELVKLGITVVAVISIAAAQALPSLQQYSTQSFQSGMAMVNSEEGVNQLAMLTKMLSLTASQQAQAKTILDQEETVAKPLVDQLKEAWDALATAEKAAAPESEMDQLARNVASISGEILGLDAKAQSKIYGQLSAEQKQKVERLPHPFFAPSAPLFPPGPVFIFDGHGPN